MQSQITIRERENERKCVEKTEVKERRGLLSKLKNLFRSDSTQTEEIFYRSTPQENKQYGALAFQASGLAIGRQLNVMSTTVYRQVR